MSLFPKKVEYPFNTRMNLQLNETVSKDMLQEVDHLTFTLNFNYGVTEANFT